MKSYLCLAALLALAGCAATSDSASSSSADTNGTTPTPGTIVGDYVTFSGRDDAVAWLNANQPGFLGTNTVAVDDPRTVRVQNLIAKHWPTIVAKFAPGIPMPLAFVVDDSVVNAFVTADSNGTHVLDAVFVESGILPLDDASLESTVIHEMGHMVTKNALYAYDSEIVKDYQVAGTEPVGITMPNDPAAAAMIEPYLQLDQNVGDSAAELDGLPDANGMYSFVLTQYASQHVDAQNADCATFQSQVNASNGIVSAATSYFDDLLRLTPDQSASLTVDVQAAESTSLTCLKPDPNVNLAATLDTLFGAPAGSWESSFSADQQALYTGKDAISGLFAVTRSMRTQMRATEAAPNFAQLRQYSIEESADDFAMTIIHAEGGNANQLGQLNLDLLVLDGGDGEARCQALLATGAVPPYSLTNPHHGECYRVYHAAEFEKYLEAGGIGVLPTPPLPTLTAHTATPMAATRSPQPKNPKPGHLIIID